eukprot:SAG31_NODE_16508_length_706_cov_1.311367_2_plen_28_part_01
MAAIKLLLRQQQQLRTAKKGGSGNVVAG